MASPPLIAVFVVGQQGGKTLQKHVLTECPPSTTLHDLGRSILPEGELVRVEARKELDADYAEFAGGLLDRTVDFVVSTAHLQFVKCFFASDSHQFTRVGV